ncbi:MAG: RNA polymerase sigma factor [Limnobacter sp.]|nr:RNA polymerase sigma factor [Limnobacter sp.]
MNLINDTDPRHIMNMAKPKLKITSVSRSSKAQCLVRTSDFEALITKQERRLRNFIIKHFRDENSAEDIFQQTLIEAYCCWDSFRGDAKRETWLFGIALNIIRNLSRRAPQFKFNFTSDEALEMEEAKDSDPMIHCMKAEFSTKLASAIEKLPPDLKDTLILVIQNGSSYQEAADTLGIPIGTVRSRISRSRAQLKIIYDLYMD